MSEGQSGFFLDGVFGSGVLGVGGVGGLYGGTGAALLGASLSNLRLFGS